MHYMAVPREVPDDGSDYEQVHFNFNSDLSGHVEVRRVLYYDGTTVEQTISLPGEAILEFVAEHIRSVVIAAVEQAPWQELLKS